MLTALPSLAFGGSLDVITPERVAAAGGLIPGQIVDGQRALEALKGYGAAVDTDRYKPLLLVTSDGPEQVSVVQCTEQRMFSVNADEPEVSGTHTEFDVVRITFALCDTGPLSGAQVRATAEGSRLRLKQVMGNAPPSPQRDALMRVGTSKVDGGEMLQFTVPVFGHGAAFLPTAVIHGPGRPSLVVQVYFADYLRLPEDPKRDSPVIAPLRRALADPAAFAGSLLRHAHERVGSR